MRHQLLTRTLLPFAAITLWACSDDATGTGPIGATPPEAAVTSSTTTEPTAPSGTVTIGTPAGTLELYPYTSNTFAGTPQDPVNLVFVGNASPVMLRAALLSLGGNRTAFGMPNTAPFDCTWSDAIGEVQAAWGANEEWTGSAIQLQCGGYGPIRFHLRLFRQGAATIANAHFELVIPGTHQHQVLNWELAEQLVTVDMLRSGLLSAAPAQSGAITQSPTFREIPAQIYNLLPAGLRYLAGGPADNVATNVGILNNGSTTIFNVTGSATVAPDTDVQDFTINYSQVIPRPFCNAGPLDYLLVQGPLQLRQTGGVDAEGNYSTSMTATGTLTVIPFNPVTRQPTGAPMTANVVEEHRGSVRDQFTDAYSYSRQTLSNGETLEVTLRAGSQRRDRYVATEVCSGA